MIESSGNVECLPEVGRSGVNSNGLDVVQIHEDNILPESWKSLVDLPPVYQELRLKLVKLVHKEMGIAWRMEMISALKTLYADGYRKEALDACGFSGTLDTNVACRISLGVKVSPVAKRSRPT